MPTYRDILECGHWQTTEVLVPIEPKWRARRTRDGVAFCFECPRIGGRIAVRRVTDVWLRLAPGAYDDLHGTLHIDAAELCVASGFEPSPENRATLERVALEPETGLLARLRAAAATILYADPDQPKGTPADDETRDS